MGPSRRSVTGTSLSRFVLLGSASRIREMADGTYSFVYKNTEAVRREGFGEVVA
jgi:hypothetical protein